jgi:hypothetical protein
MKTPINKTCSGTTTDQTKCQAAAIRRSEFCFFHDPLNAEKRRESQAQGGRQNRLRTLGDSAPDLKIEDSEDVITLLVQTINQVRKGQMDPKAANAMGYLANIIIKALEQNNFETRIEQLEALLKVQTPTSGLSITRTQ